MDPTFLSREPVIRKVCSSAAHSKTLNLTPPTSIPPLPIVAFLKISSSRKMIPLLSLKGCNNSQVYVMKWVMHSFIDPTPSLLPSETNINIALGSSVCATFRTLQLFYPNFSFPSCCPYHHIVLLIHLSFLSPSWWPPHRKFL